MLTETEILKECYDAGFDAGFNMPNRTNCCFLLFSTPEKTAEWQRGNVAGKKKKELFITNPWAKG